MRWPLCVLLAVVVGCADPSQDNSEEAADSGVARDGRGGPDDIGNRQDAAGTDASTTSSDASASPDAAPIDHLLSVATTAGGNVSATVDDVVIGICDQAQTCDFTIPHGSLAFLEANGVTLSFCTWSGGDCAGSGALCVLSMDAPKTASADFRAADQDCP